jgi:hypothetical protein
MKKNALMPPSPTVWEILQYLKDEIRTRISWEWERYALHPFIAIGFGGLCPRYPLEISLKSLTLDRYIAGILCDIGIPDAYLTSRSYKNLEKDYLSISPLSVTEFGRLNKDRVLDWLSKNESLPPFNHQLFSLLKKDGYGERLDHYSNTVLNDGGVL